LSPCKEKTRYGRLNTAKIKNVSLHLTVNDQYKKIVSFFPLMTKLGWGYFAIRTVSRFIHM